MVPQVAICRENVAAPVTARKLRFMRLRRRKQQDIYRLGFGDRAEFVAPAVIGLLIAAVLLVLIVFHIGASVS